MTRHDMILKWVAYGLALLAITILNYYVLGSLPIALPLLLPMAAEYFGNAVITKAPSYAVERIAALEQLGFTPSKFLLVGEDGYAYNGYWVKEYDRL